MADPARPRGHASYRPAGVFGLAVVIFGLGGCFQGTNQGALVADLAPPLLRGRYMALSAISWDIGFIVGPSVGGFVLDHAPLPSGRVRRPFASSRVSAHSCSNATSHQTYA